MFTGGGTLGHILPIDPVTRALRAENPGVGIYFIGTTRGMEREYVEKSGLFTRAFYLDSQGFQRRMTLANAVTLYKHFRNYKQSKRILREIKPDIVVGMGGYVSGAVMRAALALKIRTAIHEQNSVYGLTNRVLRRRVDKVLLSYDIEKSEKCVLVGNPRESEIRARYRDRIGAVAEKTVLIVGGSRGAARINDLALGLREKFRERRIRTWLVTGRDYYRENAERLAGMSDEGFEIIPFVTDLPELMLKARLVVSRAGATTIAEITALEKVCLLIPSPYVTGNHQEKNALALASRGAAVMIRETELNGEGFFMAVTELLENEPVRKRILNNLAFLAKGDACAQFVNQLNEMIVT